MTDLQFYARQMAAEYSAGLIREVVAGFLDAMDQNALSEDQTAELLRPVLDRTNPIVRERFLEAMIATLGN